LAIDYKCYDGGEVEDEELEEGVEEPEPGSLDDSHHQ